MGLIQRAPSSSSFWMMAFVGPNISLRSDYRNNSKYWDSQAWANSVDLDQMLQNVTSDQGHCLTFSQTDLPVINLSIGTPKVLGHP